MKTTRFFTLTLLMLSTLFSPNAFAQDFPPTTSFEIPVTLNDHNRMAFSPDGTTIAISGYGSSRFSSIWLFDLATGELIYEMQKSTEIDTIAFSPDGNTIAGAAVHGLIHLWDVVNGDHVRTLQGHESPYIPHLVFTPDGNTLISGDVGTDIRLWDPVTGTLRHTLQAPRAFRGLALSPDGKTLATSTARGEDVHLWDLATRQVSTTLNSGGGHLHQLAFSPDGKTLAAGSSHVQIPVRYGGGVRGVYGILLFDVASGQIRTTLQVPTRPGAYTSFSGPLAFSRDGKILVSKGRGPVPANNQDFRDIIVLWNVAKGQIQSLITPPRYEFTGMALSPDGNTIASTHQYWIGSDMYTQVLLWDISARVSITPLPVASPPIGEQLTVNLSIASGKNVGGYQATIGFHPAILRYVESENGDYLPPGAFFVPPVVDRNRVTLSAASLAGSSSGDGTLATLTFEVLAVKESRLILHESLLTDPDGRHQINITTDGQVTLPSTPATVSIKPANIWSPAVGGHLVLTVNIADGQNVADYRIIWHYDDTALRYVSETKGDYVPPGGVGNGDGTLVTLTLEVLVVRESTISISGFLTTPNGDAFTPTFEGAEIRVSVFGDINRDGAVNLLDLILVAGSIGQAVPQGGNPADVNEDGVVNVVDLVKVAGALGSTAAAPAAHTQVLRNFTASDIQAWLAQAQHLPLTDATSQQGIHFLKQLLAALTPKETALLPNYPNPFNPETWIPYQLTHAADVQIAIYDTKGTMVRQLDLGYQPVGYYTDRSKAAYWDGCNEKGEAVASGVYFYQLRVGDYTATRRMVILK